VVRRRRRRSPGRPLAGFKDGISSVAMESLESRCLFNMGPLFSPQFEPQPGAMVAEMHGDHPMANVEMFGGDRQSSPLGSTGYFSGELAPEQTLGEPDAAFAPPMFFSVIVVDIQPPGWSEAEPSQADQQPPTSSPATNLQPGVHTDVYAGDASSSRQASQDAKSATAYAVSPNVGYSNVLMTFDFDSAYVKPSIDLTLEAVRATRPDANDPGKQAPAGLPQRLPSPPTLASETGRHANDSYQQLGSANYAAVQMLGKQPAEAPARLAGGATLERPFSPGGEPETMQRVFDAALTGFRKLVEDRPDVAVAIRPAMSFATEVQDRLLQVSSELFDAQLPWASAAPLLPRFLPEAAQLGQAFDAVLADLDELGGELISSLTDGDRLLWGVGACGVVSYVAARHFHLRAAPQSPGMRRSRDTAQAAPRRVRLSVQPLLR